jgi:hypothetical protein
MAAATLLIASALVAGGSALLAQRPPAKPPDEPRTAEKTAGGTQLTPDQLVTVLARSRLNLAKQIAEDARRLYLGGEVPVTACLEADRRVLEAELELCDNPADRITVLRAQYALMSEHRRATNDLYKRDQGTRADVFRVEYERQGIALLLAEIESGRRPSRALLVTKEQIEPSVVDAALYRFTSDLSSRAIGEKFKKRITLNYPKPTSFQDVLKAIKQASQSEFDSGLPIYVDPAGLKASGNTMSTPVTIVVDNVPIATVLKTLLKPLGLTYAFDDPILRIDSVKPKSK